MLLAAALSIGLSLMADTTSQPSPPPVSTTAVVDKKPVLKCKKQEMLGSRMPVRICRSEEQIRQSEADAKEMTREFQKINPEQIH